MLYPWGHQKRYNDYSTYLKNILHEKAQKLSVDAGFTCPNRDGTKGRGGCTYCNNESFKPEYCLPARSVTQQLDEGIKFFSHRKQPYKYLAYFQTYTNTYAPVNKLKRLYFEALRHPKISGLVISTRPDCIDQQKLDMLEQLAEKFYISLEFGVESCNDETLRKVNRCHTFADTQKAITAAAGRGIHIGAHLILGLPGEDETMMLSHAVKLSSLPVNSIKFHQLQVVTNTKMAKEYRANPAQFPSFTSDEYIDIVIRFLEKLRPSIVIERFAAQSPKNMLILPHWGLKNFEIRNKIEKKMAEQDTWQGRLYSKAQI